MTDETEWEYCNYNCDKSLDVIMVAGGGMMNGNAYATIEKEYGKYYYCEYGQYPVKQYVGNKIIYDTEDYEYNFNIVDEEKEEEKEPISEIDETIIEMEKWRQGQPSFNVDDKDALQKFEKLCRDSRDKWTFTKPEDLKVGDIVRDLVSPKHERLIQVSRLSDKSIWYRKAITRKYKWKDHMGNEYTFGIWLGQLTSKEKKSEEFKEFRRKRDTKVRKSAYEDGGESWRGEFVCDKSDMIWIQEYYYDAWN